MGEHICPAQRKHGINLRRPGADAGDFNQLGNDICVSFMPQSIVIKVFLSQCIGIANFLSAQANRAQIFRRSSSVAARTWLGAVSPASSILAQIAAADAVETCWPTIAFKS